MNILITGIHGFVGSNLVEALKPQHIIYGLDLVSPEKEGVQKTFGWNELNQLPQVDVIIHLAGKAHDTKNTASAQDYFDINVGLTRQIFQHFQESGTGKFIYFSSVKAVADQIEEHLTKAPRVAEERIGDIGGDVAEQLEALAVRADGERAHDVAEERAQPHLHHVELHFSGLDLREIQQIVDDRKETRSSRARKRPSASRTSRARGATRRASRER